MSSSALVRRRIGRAALDERLIAPGPSGRLVAVHRLLALAILVRLIERPWWRMAQRPAELFEPVWAVSWLSSPPPLGILVAVQAIGALAALTAVAGWYGRWTFPVAWGSLVFVAACWGSSGKVMHNEVLLVTVAFPMLWTALPARGAPASVDQRWGWAPRACTAALGAVYFATGFQKLRHSGIDWVFSDNMAWVVRQGSSPFGRDLNVWFGNVGWLMVSLAAGALLFELSAPVLLAFRRTRIVVPIVSFTMHTSIWVFLGLNYSSWVLTAVAVAVPMAMQWDADSLDRPWYRRIVWPWQRPEGDPGRTRRPGGSARTVGAMP